MSAARQLRQATSQAAEILALTLAAEAGERPVKAQEAMAAMLANRARLALTDDQARLRFAPGLRWPAEERRAEYWPLLLGPVCRAPFQFGCWNPRHPRHAKLRAAMGGFAEMAACRRIAARAAAGSLTDPTGGATHCHGAEELPAWAIGLAPVAEIGGLVFYRLAQ